MPRRGRPPRACLSAFVVTFINPCSGRQLLFLVRADGRLQGQGRKLPLRLPLALPGLLHSPSPALPARWLPAPPAGWLASVLGH